MITINEGIELFKASLPSAELWSTLGADAKEDLVNDVINAIEKMMECEQDDLLIFDAFWDAVDLFCGIPASYDLDAFDFYDTTSHQDLIEVCNIMLRMSKMKAFR